MYTPINLNVESINAAFEPLYYLLLCKLTLLFRKMEPELGKEIPPKIRHSLGVLGVSSYFLPSLLRTRILAAAGLPCLTPPITTHTPLSIIPAPPLLCFPLLPRGAESSGDARRGWRAEAEHACRKE